MYMCMSISYPKLTEVVDVFVFASSGSPQAAAATGGSGRLVGREGLGGVTSYCASKKKKFLFLFAHN